MVKKKKAPKVAAWTAPSREPSPAPEQAETESPPEPEPPALEPPPPLLDPAAADGGRHSRVSTTRTNPVALPGEPSVPGIMPSGYVAVGTPGRNKVPGRDTPRSRLHAQIAGSVHDTTPIIPSLGPVVGMNGSPLVGPTQTWDTESSHPGSAMPGPGGGLMLWPNSSSPGKHSSGRLSGMQVVHEEPVAGPSGSSFVELTVQPPDGPGGHSRQGSRPTSRLNPNDGGGYNRHSSRINLDDPEGYNGHGSRAGSKANLNDGGQSRAQSVRFAEDGGPGGGGGENWEEWNHDQGGGDPYYDGAGDPHYDGAHDQHYNDAGGQHYDGIGDPHYDRAPGGWDGQHLGPEGTPSQSGARREQQYFDNETGSMYVRQPSRPHSQASSDPDRPPLSTRAHPLSPNRRHHSPPAIHSPSLSTMHGANMYHVPVDGNGTPLQGGVPLGSPSRSFVSGFDDGQSRPASLRSERPLPPRPDSPPLEPPGHEPLSTPYPARHGIYNLDSPKNQRPKPPRLIPVSQTQTPTWLTPVTPGGRAAQTPIIARDYALPNHARRISLAADGTPRHPHRETLAEFDDEEEGAVPIIPSSPLGAQSSRYGGRGPSIYGGRVPGGRTPVAHDFGASRFGTPVIPPTPREPTPPPAPQRSPSPPPPMALPDPEPPIIPQLERTVSRPPLIGQDSAFHENFSEVTAPNSIPPPPPPKLGLFKRMGSLFSKKTPAASEPRKIKKSKGRGAVETALGEELRRRPSIADTVITAADIEVATRIAEEEEMTAEAQRVAEEEAREIERAEAAAARHRAEQDAAEEAAAQQRAAAVEEAQSILLSPTPPPPEPPMPELPPEEVDDIAEEDKPKKGGLFRGLGSRRLKKKGKGKQVKDPSPPPREPSPFVVPPVQPEPHHPEPEPQQSVRPPSKPEPAREPHRPATVVHPAVHAHPSAHVHAPAHVHPAAHSSAAHPEPNGHDTREHAAPRRVDSRGRPQIFTPVGGPAEASGWQHMYASSVASTYQMPFADARPPPTDFEARSPTIIQHPPDFARSPTIIQHPPDFARSPTINQHATDFGRSNRDTMTTDYGRSHRDTMTTDYGRSQYRDSADYGRSQHHDPTDYARSPTIIQHPTDYARSPTIIQPPLSMYSATPRVASRASRPATAYTTHTRSSSVSDAHAPVHSRPGAPPGPAHGRTASASARYSPPKTRLNEQPIRIITPDAGLALERKHTIEFLTEVEPQREQEFLTSEQRRQRIFDEGEDRRRMESELFRREMDVWV